MDHKKKNKKDVNDEVEELLRAAEDAALLKLSLNSHNVHASPSDLDPDLDKRFRELKSGSKSKEKKERTEKMTMPKSDKVNEEVEEDARFSALKASLPKPSSSSLVGVETSDASFGDGLGNGKSGGKDKTDDEYEDEVDKIMRWAMDAARLDPSPSSDDEETFKENDSDFDDDDASHETSEEEDAMNSRKNSKKKQK